MELDDKLKYLRKVFKHNKNIFELTLIKYENLNYYIRFDYDPSLKSYYIYSVDLSYIDNKNKKYINRQYVKTEAINYLLDIYDNFNLDSYESLEYDTDIVEFRINKSVFKFNRYIPVKLYDICPFILLINMYMPSRLSIIFEELIAEVNGIKYKYEYKKEFYFNIFKDDYDKIFSSDIIDAGDKVYDSNRVKFLEEFDDKYLALVEGHDNYAYIVQVVYDKEKKTTKISSTCNCNSFCKHGYAVLKSIREKKFNNFFKVRILRKNETSFDRLMDVANSLICIGAFDNNIQVLDDVFNFINVPILNDAGDVTFEIIEDNNDELKEHVDKVVRGDFNE